MAEEIQEAVQIIRVAYDDCHEGRKWRNSCHAEGNRFLKRDA